MKRLLLLLVLSLPVAATTLSVVPVYEAVSLHATDMDAAVSESGEPLQAAVMSRPMALSGAFPETLVEAVRSPHQFPSNDPNYVEEEVNLLELCRIGLSAEITEEVLLVEMDIGKVAIPEEVKLTIRQVLGLGIEAVRKTLEAYQEPQREALKVRLRIIGTDDGTRSLRDLDQEIVLEGS